MGCSQRLNGSEIHIGNSLENNGTNNPRCANITEIPEGQTASFECFEMEGRYVIIDIPNRAEYLTLCEVEVYGSLAGNCSSTTSLPYEYQFVDKNMTWTEAQSYCRNNYTDLATIDNTEDMYRLMKSVNGGFTNGAWIGLKEGERMGTWQWSDQSNCSFRNWNIGQPDNQGGDQTCVVTWMNVTGPWDDMKCNATGMSVTWRWDDRNCDEKRPFFCYHVPSTSTSSETAAPAHHQDDMSPPSSSSSITTTTKANDNSAPSSANDNSAPSSADDNSAPSSANDNSAPSSANDNSAPSSANDNSAPSSANDNSAPSSANDNSAPSSANDNGAPSSANDNGAPSSANDNGAPSSANDNGAPSSANDNSAPSSANDNSAPSSANDNSAPSSANDNSAPSSANDNSDKVILITEKKTWTDALNYCRENHDDLVSVLSEEVQKGVEFMAKKASTPHVWLGLRYTCTLNIWFWVSGEPICYSKWSPGNGTCIEDCGRTRVGRTGAVETDGPHHWVSLPDIEQLNFICSSKRK
ncbi:macrophage mannose receptor 1 [Esox lucius]|uniref:macrophage mannose receptor 1 n=1 Tax=Esox lucius TaxID=8010 RepID=UPI001476D67A|nr:macrophage mannose receptor 1 [Esox lucius]